ncbi:MAG: alpha/beta hydrolase [Phycicoccus sp.]
MAGSAVGRALDGVRLARHRSTFLVGEVTSPARSARAAARLWFTPPPRRAAESPASGGSEFEMAVGDLGRVGGTTWGSGPPVYFVHGWGGTGAQVRSLVDPLLEHGLRVVTLDAPGHGANPPRRTHAGEFGNVLAAAVDRFGSPHGVIAHSLGSSAVWRAVEMHGVVIPRLVLLAPLVDAAGQLERFAGLLGVGRRTRSLLPQEVHAMTGLTLQNFSPRGLAGAVDGSSVLLAHDPRDTYTPFADTAALAASWPGATSLRADGSGHRRLLRDPTVVAATVRMVSQETARTNRIV